jgi:hypothetical protein
MKFNGVIQKVIENEEVIEFMVLMNVQNFLWLFGRYSSADDR